MNLLITQIAIVDKKEQTMGQCISCGKQFSCSCQMYKKKYCNQRCETNYLKKVKKENDATNAMLRLQQSPQPVKKDG